MEHETREYIKDDNGQYALTSDGKKIPVPRGITQKELMKMDFTYKPKYCKIEKRNLTILVPRGLDRLKNPEDHSTYYEIDLERCTTAAKLLDYLAQVADKSWICPELFDDLFRTVKQACKDIIGNNLQGTFCPLGKDTTVNWKKGTRTIIKK